MSTELSDEKTMDAHKKEEITGILNEQGGYLNTSKSCPTGVWIQLSSYGKLNDFIVKK